MSRNFTNSVRLSRFVLRRERVGSTIWIMSLAAFSIGVLVLFNNIMRDGGALDMLTNPVMVMLVGPAFICAYVCAGCMYNADNLFYSIVNDTICTYCCTCYNLGANFAHELLLMTFIAIAVMNILFVVRHTRTDEETGRMEVTRSLPIGRLSPLAATLLASIAVNVALAMIVGVGMGALGIASVTWGGSILYGIILGVFGLFMAAATAVFCQLSSSARGANGLSLLLLFIIYMLRAAGDMMFAPLSYVNPMGLLQRTRPFAGNIWWPVLVVLLVTAAIMALALFLNTRRDLGQGFIADKAGPATGNMRSSAGFSWRLLRNTIIVWTLTMFSFGAMYGSVLGDELTDFLATNEMLADFIGAAEGYSAAQLFIGFVTALMALICVVPALMVVLKIRGEETSGRAENSLTRSVSRTRYFSGFMFFAFITTYLMPLAFAIGLWGMGRTVLENPSDLPLFGTLAANLIYLPALWFMLSIAVFLIGWFPKRTGLVWGYFGFSFITVMLGPMLEEVLPQAVVNIGMFSMIPRLPLDSVNWWVLAMMTIAAVVLVVLGFIGFKRRDVIFG